MNLTEDHIISFAMQRWDLNKKEIAKKYLSCDSSKLSRKPLKEDPNMLYRNLFDFENKLSAAYKEKENKNALLGALKLFMVELGFRENLADIWDADYKEFVNELLQRAYIQPHEDKSNIRKRNPVLLEQNKGENVSQNETSSQQMLKIFVSAYRECRISEILSSDLFMGINPNLLSWADRFVKIIEFDVIDIFVHSKTEIKYKKISQFNNAIREYKNYLVKNTHPWERDIIRLTPNYRNQSEKDEFEKATKFYRQRIFSLYNEICDGNIFFTGLTF